MKPRAEYAYVAHRLDTSDSQNLGDFGIWYRNRNDEYDRQHYHYASPDYDNAEAPYRAAGRLINRRNLTIVPTGGPVYRECMKAVDRLIKEEAEADQ